MHSLALAPFSRALPPTFAVISAFCRKEENHPKKEGRGRNAKTRNIIIVNYLIKKCCEFFMHSLAVAPVLAGAPANLRGNFRLLAKGGKPPQKEGRGEECKTRNIIIVNHLIKKCCEFFMHSLALATVLAGAPLTFAVISASWPREENHRQKEDGGGMQKHLTSSLSIF
ncbi:MAG TPA: hypothetical protein VG738_21870 [Chitinophagaceae bacterium]|nr:hypothetical protein [Chitinophagaceae bacterium]